jgi:hypothetical protein
MTIGRYAVVDFSENPRVGYIRSVHNDYEAAKEKAKENYHFLITFTDRMVGNSVHMDEMDDDEL